MKVAPGTLIERYTILEPLGTGGMATVWMVRHDRLGSLHALKVLEIPSPEIRERLVREGQVQGQVRHPNILNVTDVLEHEQCPCLLMELVTGPALDSYMSKRALDLEQIDDLARQILAGVAAAHAAGLVHRDLKPANVLLQPEDERCVPKVADFGLAKVLSTKGTTSGRTRSGMAMGTPAYMAPEQIRDSSRVDARADVFSLGAMLFQLTTGQRPFDGDDTFEIFRAVTQGERKPVAELAPHLPARMQRAIEAALTLERDDRPENAGALRDLWVDESAPPEQPWPASTLDDLRELGPIATHSPSFDASSFQSGPSSSPTSDPTFFPAPERSEPSEPTFHAIGLEPPAASDAKETWDEPPEVSEPEVSAPEVSAPEPSAPEPSEPEVRSPAPQQPSEPSKPPRRWVKPALIAAGLALTSGGILGTRSYLAATEVQTFYAERIGFLGGGLAPLGRTFAAPDEAHESWRVTTVGGRLTEAHHVNANGKPLKDLIDGTATRVSLHQRWSDDQVDQIEVRQTSGVVTDRLTLTVDAATGEQLWTWTDRSGHPSESTPVPPLDLLPAAFGYRVQFDGDGQIAQAIPLGADGEPTSDDRLRWGLRFAYTDDHQLRQLTSLDASGAVAPDHRGVVTERYHYTPKGQLQRIERRGLGDLSVVGDDGWAVREQHYTPDQRLARVVFRDSDGELAMPETSDSACADLHLTWSDTRLEQRCMGPNGSAGWTRSGWHRRDIELDELGYPKRYAHYGLDGTPVRASNGTSQWSVAHDANGALISEGPFYDPLGSAITTKEGWAKRDITRNAQGYPEQTLYLDLQGQPTPGPKGAPIERRTYSDCMTLASTSLFSASSQPMLGSEGWHTQNIEISDDHRITRGEHRDALGQLTPNIDGIVRWTTENNERHHLISRRTLDADGNLALDLQGYAEARYERDDQGRAVSLTFLDATGEPTVPRDQEYAINRKTWDARGNPVRVEFFDPKGKPVPVIPLGGSAWVQTFNTRGELVELELRDDNDELLEGCTRIRYEYDLRGREVFQGCFDRSRIPVRVPGARWHGVEMVWDALDRKSIDRYVDVDRKPVVSEEGYAQYRYAYEPGVQDYTELHVLDEDGELMNVNGTALERRTFTAAGQEASRTWFNASLEAVEVNGWARTETVYDDRGNEVERRFYRADGSPGRIDGVASIRMRSNARGLKTWIEYLGAWGQRMLGDEGWHAKAVTWDEHGNELTVATFDETLKPAPTQEYSAFVEVKHDVFGNPSEHLMLDGDQQPTLGPLGWHRRRVERDPFGQPLQTWFLGLDGLPVNDIYGVHRLSQRWSRFGELASEERFDVQGQPAAGPDGVHAHHRRFDAHQRLVEETYLGADLQPTSGPEGFAVRTLSYDYQGRVVEERRLDPSGAPL